MKRMLRRSLLGFLGGAFLLAIAHYQPFIPLTRTTQAISTGIVISQVYGGGGNTGSTYRNDFIELFNRGNAAVSVNGWSVQYASATGTTWSVTNLTNVTIQPGQYYLVQEAVGAGGTTNLPTPDATGIINLSGTAGKVALVNTTSLLTCGATNNCLPNGNIIDFVGFGTTASSFEGTGPTPAPSNTTAVLRNANGCTDTDQNATDFTAGAPNPRNTATPLNPCAAPETAPSVSSNTPTNNATGVPTNANVTINFSEPVNVTGSWFTISCASSGTHTAAVTGGPSIFTLNPDTDFTNGELCTVTIDDLSVSDQDANDPPDNMAADYVFSFTVVSATPVLSINDVTQNETNAGTTTFSFNVTLNVPAGAGGVTFSVDTADGTAQDDNPATEDNDYVPIVGGSGSIPASGSSTTVNVTVNGDTNFEPNETFFVNVTNIVGATPGDTQGQGTIQNDDVTPIHDIQGSGTTSPLSGSVSTRGVVTLVKSNGFFLQEPDATTDTNPLTSEGIFVFTSSAPTVVVGADVTVTGTIQEFGTTLLFGVVGTNTEISSPTSIVTNSTGNSLPTAITLTVTDLDPTALPSHLQLERYEDMRVSGSLTTVAPNDSFSDVYTVLSSVTRPIREIGLEISATIPTDPSSTANIPRWDENSERLSVDLNGRAGSSTTGITSNVSLGTVTGPLDFAFGEYHLIPEVNPTAAANISAVPVPVPLATEFTVGCFNIENFANGATQRQKAARAIRQVMRYPDIIGHEEIASLSALQALRDQVNNDAVGAGDPNPLYEAYLMGTGAQNVGFLVKTARVQVISVTEEPVGTYINPLTSGSEPLHDRPPLVLRATVDPLGPNPIPVIVVVNHPRSFIDIGDDPSPPGDGKRVRAKRKAQAESIAALLDSLQDNNPGNSIMTIGDFNAFQFNDGYTDPIATIKGNPTADDQMVVDASPDLVSPDFTNLTSFLPAAEQYSFIFAGTAQTLDHVIVNRNALARFTRYAIARFDSDFPGTPAAAFVNDASRPEGASDHDAPVAYFNLTLAPTAADSNISGQVVDHNGTPVAGAAIRMSGTQNRLTITDAFGNYHFDEVETNGLYTVVPSRANFTFSPSQRTFSQLGQHTNAAFTGSTTNDATNPLDRTEYFVRQQYLDFLNREPDEAGFNFWVNNIESCGADQNCRSLARIHTSGAFFMSIEFQQTGYLVYRTYQAAYGDTQNAPVPIRLNEFKPDTAEIGNGVVVLQTGWEQKLDNNKQAYAAEFVQRARFVAAYPTTMTPSEFVNKLFANAGVAPAAADLSAAINEFGNAGTSSDLAARGRALWRVAENSTLAQQEFNQAFVLMQYFGYLQRDPNTGPNTDFSGYDFWLNKLNTFGGNFQNAEMVNSFLVSGEYRGRFPH